MCRTNKQRDAYLLIMEHLTVFLRFCCSRNEWWEIHVNILTVMMVLGDEFWRLSDHQQSIVRVAAQHRVNINDSL